MRGTLAKYCLPRKHHFAWPSAQTWAMSSKSANHVLAENLAAAMAAKGMTQSDLARASGVGQTTISLYLRPGDRQPSASGKQASAKLAEVEQIAKALGIEYWQLLKPQDAGDLALAIDLQEVLRKHRDAEAATPRKANSKR